MRREHVDLRVLVEIDEDVAAEDDVEGPEGGEVPEEVERAVLDHRLG